MKSKFQISKQVLNLGFLIFFGIWYSIFGILSFDFGFRISPRSFDEATRRMTGSDFGFNNKVLDKHREGKVYMAGMQASVVESVVRRQNVTNLVAPDDPDFYKQDYLHTINAQAGWAYATGADTVIVALIDSGVDIDHPDLVKNIWRNPNEIEGNGVDDDGNGYVDDINGWDFVSDVADPRPKFDEPYTKLGIIHGTVVAGVLAARGNNNTGITGVSWRAKIMPLRILNSMGEGTTDDVASAMNYARRMGARVINLSFVGHDSSLTMTEAIQDAYKEGIFIVAAAGNEVREGINLDLNPAYPVCQNGPGGQNWVFGVTSLDLADRRANFSNYGRSCIDAAAPGVSVYSTVTFRPTREGFDRPYSGWWTGTSVAAPQVSGAAALLWSLKPSLSLRQVQDLIKEYGKDVDKLNPEIGGLLGRRLDLHATLEHAARTQERPTAFGKPYGMPAPSFIITAPLAGRAPEVRIYDDKAKLIHSWFAFPQSFRVGVNVAAGDLDEDGEIEVVAAARKGASPQVHVYALSGTRKSSFFAYHPNFTGGFNVAVGDVDGDGVKEIVTTPLSGGGPHVRVFEMDGSVHTQFFAFDERMRAGLSVATGDVDGDGVEEIIVGSGPGMPATVRIFRVDGTMRRELLVFPSSFQGGVSVAAADLDGNGTDEVVVGAGKGGGPQVRVITADGDVYLQFFAFSISFRGGITVSAGDVNRDGREELLIGAGSAGAPQVAVYNNEGKAISRFNAFEAGFRQGINVASGD